MEYDWNTPIYTDITIYAKFEKHLYIITYLTDGNGTIWGNESQAVYYLENGEEVKAIPNIDHEFNKWSDGVTTSTRQEKNVISNITVMAMFKKKLTPPHEPNPFILDKSELDSGDYYV